MNNPNSNKYLRIEESFQNKMNNNTKMTTITTKTKSAIPKVAKPAKTLQPAQSASQTKTINKNIFSFMEDAIHNKTTPTTMPNFHSPKNGQTTKSTAHKGTYHLPT